MTTHPCPDCRCADDATPTPPATSSPGIRRMAKQTVAAAVRTAKEKGGRL